MYTVQPSSVANGCLQCTYIWTHPRQRCCRRCALDEHCTASCCDELLLGVRLLNKDAKLSFGWCLAAQVMPPFDPEMAEPIHTHLRSKARTRAGQWQDPALVGLLSAQCSALYFAHDHCCAFCQSHHAQLFSTLSRLTSLLECPRPTAAGRDAAPGGWGGWL